MLNNPLLENLNGTDMLPYLCENAVKNRFRIFLLGAQPGVAEKAKANLIKKFNGLQISGTQHGYFGKEEEQKVIEKINKSKTDILLVALGVPKQEKWICGNLSKLQVKVAMGVGGLFDFYSGKIKRAPRWMREVGLEWLYRVLQEPKRMWRRYIIGNPLFLLRVIKWKMAKQNIGEL
jgi:N-acetylglucosaminyldiphosphoundecaprenol N-acetyl-beta-D-mannosaminyltransferase